MSAIKSNGPVHSNGVVEAHSRGEAKKVRLSLELSNELNNTLEELAEKNSTTKTDLLRKAIALIEVAVDAKENDQSLGVIDDKGRVVTKIVGL